MHAQEEFQRHRVGKFGRVAKAAVDGIIIGGKLAAGCPKNFQGQRPGRSSVAPATQRGRAALLQVTGELVSLLLNLLAPVLIDISHREQHAREAGHCLPPVLPVTRREVGAAIEWTAIGCEEDRHGPAALLGQGLHRLHVDIVDVGPFLAIHLDRDEMLIHERGNLLVFK